MTIKVEDFDFANILLDEKSYKNILFIKVHLKLWVVQNHYVLGSIK